MFPGTDEKQDESEERDNIDTDLRSRAPVDKYDDHQ